MMPIAEAMKKKSGAPEKQTPKSPVQDTREKKPVNMQKKMGKRLGGLVRGY